MNYSNYNDYELIYMVRENNEDSEDLLINKYIPIIMNISNYYYDRYSNYGYDRDDFIQEGYFGFLKAIKKYDEKKNALFYTFLVLCLHRTLITFCNRISNSKKNINGIYLDSIDDVDVADKTCDTEQYFLYRNNIDDIWKIIYRKPIEYISVFELRWNHFTYDEISKLLDISHRKVSTMYKNCIKSIQEEMIDYL